MVDIGKLHFTQTAIICKWCGSTGIKKYGTRKGIQEYFCLKCRRKFIAKDAPYCKQTTSELIGTSISSYYDGLSFADIARHLAESGNPVNESTVYRWVTRDAEKTQDIFRTYHPRVSDTWVADETAIKFNKNLYWIWDIIDSKTRFLLASYLSSNRGTKQARILMERASQRANMVPKRVITDKLAGYIDGIELAFGAGTQHIQSGPFAKSDDTNIIERFQGTIKDRTKVVRGFKTFDTAVIILDGFLIHYNFFKPHLSLKGKTPADVARLKLPFKTWTEFVRQDK